MSTLIESKGLTKYFPLGGYMFSKERRVVHAVDGVNIQIAKGEVLGLVGESGCGKTTLGRLFVRLLKPTAGSVYYKGETIFQKKRDTNNLSREIQMIFQDPSASLNPRKTIRQILSRPYIVHKIVEGDEIEERILDLLDIVNLSPSESFIDRYPHELSGGQRQRIGISRVLALRPEFIVADEPVSSLDLSIRANVLNLLAKTRKEFNLTMLYITHDLSVVRSLCNKIAVMYIGQIVEIADIDDFYEKPLHPYAEALLSATPIPNPKVTRSRKRIILKGEIPNAANPPTGCRFHTRCPHRMHICSEKEPNLIKIENGHSVACFLRN